MKSNLLLVCLLGALILSCYAFDFGDDDEEFWKIEQLKPRYGAGRTTEDKRKQSSRSSRQKLDREPERERRWKGDDKYAKEERDTSDHDGAYVRFSRSKSIEEAPSRRQNTRRGRDYDSQEHSFEVSSVETRNKFFNDDSEDVHSSPKRSQGRSGYHSSAFTRTKRDTDRDDPSEDSFQPTTTRSTRGRGVSGQSDIRRVHTQSKTSCKSNPHVIIEGVERTRQNAYGKDYLANKLISIEENTSQSVTTEPNNTTTNETTTTDGSDTSITTTTDSNSTTTTETSTDSTNSTDASTTTNTSAATTTEASNSTTNTTTGNDASAATEVPTESDNTTTTTNTTDSATTTTDNSTTTAENTTTTADSTTTDNTATTDDTTTTVSDTSTDSSDSVTQVVVITEDSSNDAAASDVTEQPTVVEQPQNTEETADTQTNRGDSIDKIIKTARGSLSTRKFQSCRCECDKNAAHHH